MNGIALAVREPLQCPSARVIPVSGQHAHSSRIDKSSITACNHQSDRHSWHMNAILGFSIVGGIKCTWLASTVTQRLAVDGRAVVTGYDIFSTLLDIADTPKGAGLLRSPEVEPAHIKRVVRNRGSGSNGTENLGKCQCRDLCLVSSLRQGCWAFELLTQIAAYLICWAVGCRTLTSCGVEVRLGACPGYLFAPDLLQGPGV